ncbi:MAG TPA: hypothetical protein VMF69_04945 [Gemmataceae bacterium]|nr:hypothetical protein [Gemmataceae bacterium]
MIFLPGNEWQREGQGGAAAMLSQKDIGKKFGLALAIQVILSLL